MEPMDRRHLEHYDRSRPRLLPVIDDLADDRRAGTVDRPLAQPRRLARP